MFFWVISMQYINSVWQKYELQSNEKVLASNKFSCGCFTLLVYQNKKKN